jgi:hypothetical protein
MGAAVVPIDIGSRPFASGNPPFETGVSKIGDADR